MSLDRDERAEIAAICDLCAGSVAAVVIAYCRWSDVAYGSVFWTDFHQWRWIRLTLMLTLVTSLAARAGTLPNRKVGILDNPLGYAVVVVPIVVLMMAPSSDSFMAADEGDLLVLMALLGLVHGWGFAFLRSLFRKGLARYQSQ
jgi:hypothetical protein